jgi:hypothetical protein
MITIPTVSTFPKEDKRSDDLDKAVAEIVAILDKYKQDSAKAAIEIAAIKMDHSRGVERGNARLAYFRNLAEHGDTEESEEVKSNTPCGPLSMTEIGRLVDE